MPQIRRRKPEEEGEINITPMLDIVFIMLIFFIVTTSFVKEPGINPSRPFAQTAATKELGNIMIAVSRDDHIWMNKNRVELAGVRQLVEAARAENPESSVIIVADESASTGMVIDLMDQVRAAGVTSVALAAEGVD
ncbi:MAG: biopolymer transporter ExbD [Gammaproteobacteria bacterium]|nr:biopolymer transporter ExbD [Gammaproteobacteria bacterium]MDE0413017.1 biopolymer transporter ExbD [Gammaproteobacteria bacterium]MDE0489261.1 biopolymer transporter ExbD [Gammaproteobacteria bacterium]